MSQEEFMKFGNLKTGDVVNLCGTQSVVLSITKPHPEWPAGPYWLFVWYIFDEKRLSFDCLHPDYALIPGSTLVNDGLVLWHQAIDAVARS
jgi:hypothetical protein